ncbi:hypothetical protein HBDW_41500 [Herbaspirillum sp. DW155]|uniref:Imm71 family immunity protein n=1 Tax=Herbaspirillum sp. DW155 TaxID=3095609 RepID=UPI003085A7FE|nr:hypothetical protein HBDW_41500 [Herbaspirillum sp. DW155]
MDIQDILLPSRNERRQIFHYLKKISSLTAWQRIFEFYQAWVNVAESSVREADTRGWGKMTSLPYSDYTFLLKSLAHCEEVQTARVGAREQAGKDNEQVLINPCLNTAIEKSTALCCPLRPSDSSYSIF